MSDHGRALRVRAGDGDMRELLSPCVGIFRPMVFEGRLVSGGQSIGGLDVLGVEEPLVVPEGVAGRVQWRIGGGRSRVPVQYGDALLVISTATFDDVSTADSQAAVEAERMLSFAAPMSGRFYGRPSPSEAPFIMVGETVKQGQTIGLLEVMKTFNRVVYEGDTLPPEARVEGIVPNDGDDVTRGYAILLLESPDED